MLRTRKIQCVCTKPATPGPPRAKSGVFVLSCLHRMLSRRGGLGGTAPQHVQTNKKALKSAKKHKRAQKGAQKCCSSLPGAASALEEAVRACFGAASALEEAVRACFGAASAFEKAVRVCCSRSLFESAALGYTVLCASLLGSPCSVHGYARVHTSTVYEAIQKKR